MASFLSGISSTSSDVALSPDGYRKVRDDSIQTWKGRPLPGLLVYYLRDAPAIPHSCPVDGCTNQFFGDGIRAHLKAVHRGITSQLYLTCRECGPKVSCIVAKNYATHFLDRHSGHSILCAYCLTPQSRAKNLPRHLVNHCSGLSYPKKRRVSRTGFSGSMNTAKNAKQAAA